MALQVLIYLRWNKTTGEGLQERQIERQGEGTREERIRFLKDFCKSCQKRVMNLERSIKLNFQQNIMSKILSEKFSTKTSVRNFVKKCCKS